MNFAPYFETKGRNWVPSLSTQVPSDSEITEKMKELRVKAAKNFREGTAKIFFLHLRKTGEKTYSLFVLSFSSFFFVNKMFNGVTIIRDVTPPQQVVLPYVTWPD